MTYFDKEFSRRQLFILGLFFDLIGMLLTAGANPDIKDDDGLTARDILRSIGCNERFGL